MELLRRVVDLTLTRVGGWCTPQSEVLLRHAPSGQVLTDGRAPATPITFPDRATALSFQRRFLDEADAWEPVPATITRAA